MKLNVRKYSEWRDTAETIHLLLQMMGKVKLSRMEAQPEWNHVLLNPTAHGFTTGLIPNYGNAFEIEMDLYESEIRIESIAGNSSEFPLRKGTPISAYFTEFKRMLSDVMCETEIYPGPQEMSVTTLFNEDHTQRDYDREAAIDFFRMCVFAHEEIYKFIAPFRGKRILPSFFWGTFDMTGVLFGGEEAPWNGEGIIEAAAFDENMMEFGFWPGDDAVDDPTFYILTYPFPTKDYTHAGIKPDKAIFSTAKAEFFLTLEDALSYNDASGALQKFFRSGYEIFSKGQGWGACDWIEKPLIIEKGSTKIKE
jgi:hypothetical protein